jgi:hypothetical protein
MDALRAIAVSGFLRFEDIMTRAGSYCLLDDRLRQKVLDGGYGPEAQAIVLRVEQRMLYRQIGQPIRLKGVPGTAAEHVKRCLAGVDLDPHVRVWCGRPLFAPAGAHPLERVPFHAPGRAEVFQGGGLDTAFATVPALEDEEVRVFATSECTGPALTIASMLGRVEPEGGTPGS